MKKILAILLAAVLLLSVVGCNKTPPEVSDCTDNQSVEEQLLSYDSYDVFEDEIYLCDDVYRSDDTPTHGTGTIALPMGQDVLEVKDYKILLCGDGCAPEAVVSRASQGYAPAYRVVPDGEIDGNFKVLKFKMELDEAWLNDTINSGFNVAIEETLESKYFYLLVLDEKHYAYINLEVIDGVDEVEYEAELADSIVKNARISFEPKNEKLDLTLERVIRLAENKGEELSWSDFQMYNAIETGSGLYILVYEIDEIFDLMIGGSSPVSSPMYIRLVTKADWDNYIDIRTEDVKAFIVENRASPLTSKEDLTGGTYKLIADEIGSELIEELEDSYTCGETVTVTVGTVTETNQYLWVNAEKISPTDRTLLHTTFTFVMPDCDVKLRLEYESVDIPTLPHVPDSEALYGEIAETSQLPADEDKAIFSGAIIGGSVKFYCFEPGTVYYKYDAQTNKYYKCTLELPEGYENGEIIDLRSGAGSGEIEITVKSTNNGETVYWGCIVSNEVTPQAGKQILPSGICDQERLTEMGISLPPICGYPTQDDFEVQLTDVSNKAVTDFAVRLFKESIEDGTNTLISPLSVLAALSMTANGADNETLSQMEAVLGMPIDQLNLWISTYMSNLPEEEKYKLSLANSIWFKDTESFTVDKDFLQTCADCYDADIFKAPFDNSTLKKINKWVENETNGRIKDILDKISKDAIMYLINALAFDAEWQEIYYEFQIRDGQFTAENGTKREIELMYSSEGMYLEDSKATGFIKYYKNRKYAFAALLPNKDVTVSEYIASLDGEHLNEILANAKQNVVSAAIPKFETEYKVEMSDILKGMGMPNAFSDTLADFSKIGKSTNNNICISRVIHHTYINVNGKGTEAGAATVVELEAPTSARMDIEPPKEVYLDRPFVYMLIDCENNIPFFIGTVKDIEK